ncbi:4-hydroxybenzoyl-CoA thioesterase [Leifsonia sp. ALI-44-B]|uniref:acyl-CoA thioesterase n=1 Tax=Leifsonia sp. ALI-44-B TaxID=1933776 RepID=UPI00097C7751|nr:thioesterase family protein [Leifsonia sp. ALI-44-B]ONI63782.1 4-hydroxybenzoyl-CoA thioesterase [Leifsonia sp. ALI-44-B]
MRLHVPIPLRWGDLDAFNHVNNVSMLKLLEEARVRAFWQAESAVEDIPSTAVIDAGLDTDTLTLVAHHEIEYLAPVPYQRDPLDVQMWLSKIGGASMEVCYEVFSPADGGPVLVARARTAVVMASAETGKPRRITPAERQVWEPYLGEPIVFSRG